MLVRIFACGAVLTAALILSAPLAHAGGHGGGHGGGGHGGHNGGHNNHGRGFGGGGFYGFYGGYGYGGYGYGGYGYGGYGHGYAGYDYPDYVTDDGAPVHVTVQVPADAEVWFNEVKTQQTGTTRRFVSPPLAPGNYRYDIRASWGSRSETRQVTVHPGDDISVQFKSKTAPAAAP